MSRAPFRSPIADWFAPARQFHARGVDRDSDRGLRPARPDRHGGARLQSTGDAQYRSEAAYLATDNLARCGLYDLNLLIADFSDTAGAGTPYDEFKKTVALRLPGASLVPAPNPAVTITNRGGVGAAASNGFDVDITVSATAGRPHHTHTSTTATVRLN
jgi:hypothetical protein